MLDFDYLLPDEKIARFPLSPRDSSKLLVCRKGQISHHQFSNLPDLLPPHSLLVLNETQVVPARIFFTRPSGKIIEVFVLNPADPSINANIALQAKSPIAFTCLVGGRKAWKPDQTLSLSLPNCTLSCSWLNRDNNTISFEWDNDELSFSEILHEIGQIPLPPYLNRDWEESDRENYQTVYARYKGSVAAPTAGLHFTDRVFQELLARNFKTLFTTLHVGAGTFLPVKSDLAQEHRMHHEQIVLDIEFLRQLQKHEGPVVPVGTTSCRLLESIYWLGAKIHAEPNAEFIIEQSDAYSIPIIPKDKALQNVIDYMTNRNMSVWSGLSALYIMPGYSFRMTDALITNFHQPKSTLLLLIASLIGDDWKKVYTQALESDYRFLSYGDSSLLIP